ncbi:pilus assembly protein TadG-related protein [Sphingomonas alba]|uniref:Pilus assembly protein TadG-related protein n=1 Tax=Sphingomonas alba TaxID=2908208 RepID=A0ABT0RPC1_9SPHN|nr:pilus assembly protein TadG-related protein [Sphingomonas alba]MCL6684504.1 pilus assembly protein TadG-related protein [Sphingomonas alba]
MWAGAKRLIKANYGAVAPTVALSLFALIGAGGIAFDYAHLAAMDTELQQAADQAALAAATQLDRSTGARARAAAVIQTPGTNRLAANITKFANDDSDSGTSVEIASVTFCKTFDDGVANTATACTAPKDDTDSVFVVVTTELRTANYALTPVVAAFSGTISATAVAGVQSSVCNIAPIFVCTDNMDFPTDADIGKGLLMKTGSGNSWVPGNYGLLDFSANGGGGGNTGVIDALLGHGLNGCLANDAVTTEPGNKNVTDAINTRMDVYAGSPATKNPSICVANSDGTGCPAANTGKDMVITLTATANNSTSSTPPAAKTCPTDPKTVTPAVAFQESKSPIKGFNRDNCHYSGTCGNFGNGVWDYSGYMAANHPGVDTSSVPHAGTTPTRYEVYKWELGDSTRTDPKSFVTTVSTQRNNGRWDHTVTTQCTYNRPVFGTSNYTAQKDRRLLPVVAANCDLLNGKGSIGADFKIVRVFDVFVTEPSLNRTSYPGPSDEKEIYGEVVGPAKTFAGTSGFQYYARSKPYLVR